MGLGKGKEAVSALASEIQASCTAIGWPPETALFHPHVTLARSKSALPLRHLPIEKAASAALETFRVEKIALLQSHLSASNARYETLYRVPLR
jgi:2'-5' RNA ligase